MFYLIIWFTYLFIDFEVILSFGSNNTSFQQEF